MHSEYTWQKIQFRTDVVFARPENVYRAKSVDWMFRNRNSKCHAVCVCSLRPIPSLNIDRVPRVYPIPLPEKLVSHHPPRRNCSRGKEIPRRLSETASVFDLIQGCMCVSVCRQKERDKRYRSRNVTRFPRDGRKLPCKFGD